MIEVYTQDKIHFMAPLSQQQDFYVPEAKENIPEEYLQEGNESSFDYSLLNASRNSADRSSRDSSVSAFSRSYASSRVGDETFSDEDSDIDKHEDSGEEIQDGEVSSSIEARASKACTNLLEESDKQENESFKEDGTALTEEEGTTGKADDSLNILQDSGICSGRTSASPSQSQIVPDANTSISTGDNDGEDSSSSFEEIKMETVEKEMPSPEPVEENTVNK